MVAFAQTSAIPNPINGVPAVFDVLCNVAAYFVWTILVLSMVMIGVSAFNFLTSGGEPEKLRKARSYIIYAAVGIAVALMASVFPVIVGTAVGYKSQSGKGLTPMCALFGGTG